nr:MAG TPA: hypothetical protein [Caudoviricetes sp.]
MNNNIMNALMQMVMGGANPQQILQNMMNQNPQMRGMINQINQSGMTPQQYLNQYAKQNNINLDNNPLVQMLKQQGKIK